MRTLQLVLAAEHALFRAGLKAIVEREGAKVVGETGSGREAVVLAKKLRPSVVLIEPDLAELGGLEAAAQILHFSPETRVVLMSVPDDERNQSRAHDLGAWAILPRSATPYELSTLLRSVVEARPGEPPPASAARKPAPAFRRFAGARLLTPRQLEVLKLLSEGSGVKKIARELGISPKTVETHRSQIMGRLHIYDLPGLVRFALREKISRL